MCRRYTHHHTVKLRKETFSRVVIQRFLDPSRRIHITARDGDGPTLEFGFSSLAMGGGTHRPNGVLALVEVQGCALTSIGGFEPSTKWTIVRARWRFLLSRVLTVTVRFCKLERRIAALHRFWAWRCLTILQQWLPV